MKAQVRSPYVAARAGRLLAPVVAWSAFFLAAACGQGTPHSSEASGGAIATGGAELGSGGALASGGVAAGGSAGGAPASGGALGTGGAPASGGALGTGGASTGGSGNGGSSGSGGAGTGGGDACAHECVAQCVPWGGTPQGGFCPDETECCTGATPPPENPLAHLAVSAEQVGGLLANRFRQQSLTYSSVSNLPGDGYKNACEWYGALGVAKHTENQQLLDGLVAKFDPLEVNFVQNMLSGEKHVDRYIYGMVPLEIYLQTNDESYRGIGTQVADSQQTTNQTRDAIDDMFMMTGLQLEAYRATNDTKYLDFMSDVMVDYLGAQRQNGLFFHNVSQAPVHWGRGNGWFAAGMAEMMRDLPQEHPNYATILAGYRKMMEGLLPYQSEGGLWYQVLDMPTNGSNWEESSGSAMFTYAMIAGVRRGILSAETYVPVIEAAWSGLQAKISAQGDVRDVCVGTWYKANAQEYMMLTRLVGDGHGQAPVLWAAAELLR